MGDVHITLPMGLGDCHWVLTKMTALRRHVHPHRLIAYVAHGQNHQSANFLRLTNFFDDVIEDERALKGVPENHRDPKWSTLQGSEHWRNFDFCLQANGHLERGERLDTWLPELGPPEYSYRLALEKRPDPQVLLYPSGLGPNAGFRTGWGRPQWYAILRLLNEAGYIPTFVGANTPDDLGYMESLRLKGDYVNLVGKTTTQEYLELISTGLWFGLNSGGGILSAMMGRPTIMLWSSEQYGGMLHRNMMTSWLPEDHQYYAAFPYGRDGVEQEATDHLLRMCDKFYHVEASDAP